MGLFRKKIGLALGSGGARGLAHIGVIKELEKNNIAIDYISGSSIGALIGGIYAYTKNIKIIEEIAYSKGYKDLFNAFFDPSFKSGIFNGEKILALLNGYIPDDALIQHTKIPFAAVATDIQTAQSVTLKEGNLKQAIRASISIPILLKPIEYQNMLLIDGGTTEPVPINAAKELGAQRVIGVNLYSQMFPKKFEEKEINMMDIFKTIVEISLYNTAISNMNCADVQLNLPVDANLPLTAFAKDPSELIEIGEKATKEAMNKLKLL